MRAALVFCALAAPAAAQDCVTGGDLATGIVFEYENGGVERLTAVDPLTVRSAWTEEGETSEAILARGLYYVVDFFEQERMELYRPVGGYAALPVPEVGLSTTVDLLDVQDLFTFIQWQIDVGPLEVFAAGDCGYSVLTVTITYGDQGAVETIRYFPDLGVGAFVGFADAEGEPYDNPVVKVRAVGQ